MIMTHQNCLKSKIHRPFISYLDTAQAGIIQNLPILGALMHNGASAQHLLPELLPVRALFHVHVNGSIIQVIILHQIVVDDPDTLGRV